MTRQTHNHLLDVVFLVSVAALMLSQAFATEAGDRLDAEDSAA